MLDTTHLVPLRTSVAASADLVAHLRDMATMCTVVVVDSSPDDVFDLHRHAFGSFARHVRPDPRHRCSNGKVHNVRTGLDHVATTSVVIADDDVRHTPHSLCGCVALLARADVVVPQNVFVAAVGERLPWHAVWDTARSLLNRVSGGDLPGTLVCRTEVLRRTGGYDGDVLFENLELLRTVRAAGGTLVRADDVYVPRRPPTTRHFLGQRVRQAYDEFARPHRMAAQLAILPCAVIAALRSRRAVVCTVLVAMSAAEIGRRREGGAGWFPATASLLAPLWLLERGCCSWLALAARARGGVRYGGGRLVVAANGVAVIRERLARGSAAAAGHHG